MSTAVSVVMPVYNGQRFLEQALDSIVAQTYRDFDFHVVDDGSTDDTPRILRRYAARDPRIILHTLERNQGFAAALNVGCRAARGDLIARMDADDVSLPNRLERQITFLRRHSDVGVLGTCVQVIDEDGRLGAVWPCPAQPGLTAWTLMFTCIVVHPSVMLRRSLLERSGFYPLGYTPVEDYALWMRMAKMTRITNLPDVLVRYREVGSSLSRAANERVESESVRVVRETIGNVNADMSGSTEIGMLRALARHNYPRNAPDTARAAGMLEVFAKYVTALHPLTSTDRYYVRLDAGVRLWLLAAVALSKRSPSLASRLAWRSVVMSPVGIFPFIAKVTRRILGV
jgi:glycosyltransferase involved in cell wall biosynthesis